MGNISPNGYRKGVTDEQITTDHVVQDIQHDTLRKDPKDRPQEAGRVLRMQLHDVRRVRGQEAWVTLSTSISRTLILSCERISDLHDASTSAIPVDTSTPSSNRTSCSSLGVRSMVG